MGNHTDQPNSSDVRGDEQRNRRLDFRTERVQYWLALIALVHVVAFVFGALLGFAYLLMHQFNPSGINASDTLAMLLWSLGFAATLALGTGFATIAGFPAARALHFSIKSLTKILRLFKPWDSFPLSGFWWDVHYGWPYKLKWRQVGGFAMLVGCFALALIVWFIVELPLEQGSFFLAVLSLGVFLSFVAFGKMDQSYEPWRARDASHPIDIRMQRYSARKRSFILAVVVSLSITMVHLGTWLDICATSIGFRAQNVSVRLAKEDFDELIEQSMLAGVVVNPCEDIAPESSVLRHADILWQSLGTHSLLRFPSLPLGISSKADGTIRLRTKNDALGGVVSRRSPTQCREFLMDTLFHEGTAELRKSGSARLDEQLPWIRNRPAGWKLKVFAYPDQSAGTSQLALTLRQALTIKALIEARLKLPAGVVEAVGQTQSAAKLDCITRATVNRALCDKANRRVKIFFYEST